MSTDSVKKTLIVTLGVCIVCSILVSTAAVYLKPIQDKNKALEKRKNILKAGDLAFDSNTIEKVFSEQIQTAVVELKTGKQLSAEEANGELNPESYNIKTISKLPKYSRETPKEVNGTKLPPIGLKRVPTYSLVYFVKDKTDKSGAFSKLILPIHGKGLWSTMYGFLALDSDLKTVKGITFYDHGETPGLGGEIENAKWQATWKDKLAFDQNGKVILQVLHKKKASPDSKSEIDCLSGATLTTQGVDFLIKYWLGPEGYGPFIASLRKPITPTPNIPEASTESTPSGETEAQNEENQTEEPVKESAQ